MSYISESHPDPDPVPRHPVVASFLMFARNIPEVISICVQQHEQDLRLWTIISAPPYEDSYRYKVYDAEYEALRGSQGHSVDFRLINILEVEGHLEDILPIHAKVLYSSRRTG